MSAFDSGSFGAAFDLFVNTSVTNRGFTYASIPTRNHTTEAYNRLWQQFKDKPNIQALLAIFTARYDDLEAAFYALLTERTIYNASGAQLDLIGKVVGQPRQGLDDDTYRRYILARIAANSSDGLVEDLISVTRLILNNSAQTLQVVNAGVATAITRVTGDRVEWETAVIIANLLRVSVSAGVRMLLEFETFPAVTITKASTGSAWDAGASSSQTFAGDGYAYFICPAPSGQFQRMFGLTDIATPTHSFNIKWAFYLCRNSANSLTVYETGNVRIDTTFAAGDVLKIQRIGSTISFLKNGALLYTSAITSSSPLRFDNSFFTASGSLADVRLYDAGKRINLGWSDIKNVSISPPGPQAFSARPTFADATIYAAGAGGYPLTAADVKATLGVGNWTGGAGWLFDELSGNPVPVFGSPTLTASALVYGIPGVRGWSDKAIGFQTSASTANGGSVFDVSATSDIIVIWAGRFAGLPAGLRTMLAKLNGSAVGYRLYTDTSNTLFWQVRDGTINPLITVAGPTLGAPHVGIAVLERATSTIRVATRTLAGVSTLSSNQATGALGDTTNAANFCVGGDGGVAFGAPETLNYSALYVDTGVGIATGLSANIDMALTNFVNRLNTWPYLRSGAVPNYGNGLDDYGDKFSQSAIAIRAAVQAGSWATGAGYHLNESSGNVAAAYGTPAILTASGSITYGVPGPRGGRDTAIRFGSGNNSLDGGSNFDAAAGDLFCVYVGRWTGAPTAFGTLFGKVTASLADGWVVFVGSGNNMVFDAKQTGGVEIAGTAITNFLTGEWHAGLLCIDRVGNIQRHGIQGLVSGTQVLGGVATPGTNNYTTTAPFRLGATPWTVAAQPNFDLDEFHLVTGSGVATGVGNQFSTVLANYAAAINRYYGGRLTAVLE